MKGNIILIQIACITVIFGVFGIALFSFALYSCEDDYSYCDREYGICPFHGGSCKDYCTSGSKCYYGDPGLGQECALDPLGLNCVCWFSQKDETKENCGSYFKTVGSVCHFNAEDKCTSGGWGCETKSSCDLGGCCRCTEMGCASGPHDLCPLRYCGGEGGVCV